MVEVVLAATPGMVVMGIRSQVVQDQGPRVQVAAAAEAQLCI